MTHQTSRVERDLIIQYLSDELPALVFSFTSFAATHGAAASPHVRRSADTSSADVRIPSGAWKMERTAIIAPRSLFARVADLARDGGTRPVPVTVSFYFRGRGLRFESSAVAAKNSVIVPVPEAILRQTEAAAIPSPRLTALVPCGTGTVLCAAEETRRLPMGRGGTMDEAGFGFIDLNARFDEILRNTVNAVFPGSRVARVPVQERARSVFVSRAAVSPELFAGIPVSARVAANGEAGVSPSGSEFRVPILSPDSGAPACLLTVPFPAAEDETSESGMGRAASAFRHITACAASAAWASRDEQGSSSVSAVEGRAEPPVILYLDDERLCVGFQGVTAREAVSSGTFSVRISFGPRALTPLCRLRALVSADDRLCVEYEFTETQEEDRRVLYEWYYGLRYGS